MFVPSPIIISMPQVPDDKSDELTPAEKQAGASSIKFVREHPGPWELYDIDADRAELQDQAAKRLDVVTELTSAWSAWANRVGVIPWERVKEIYLRDGKGDPTG